MACILKSCLWRLDSSCKNEQGEQERTFSDCRAGGTLRARPYTHYRVEPKPASLQVRRRGSQSLEWRSGTRKSVSWMRIDTKVVGPLMVARVTGEGLMVDQNEVAVVWVTREAQAKADRRPWTVAGTVARVTRRLCLPSISPTPTPPHPTPRAIAE